MKGVSRAQANVDTSVFIYSTGSQGSHCFLPHTVTESLTPGLEDFVSTSRRSGLSPNPL